MAYEDGFLNQTNSEKGFKVTKKNIKCLSLKINIKNSIQ